MKSKIQIYNEKYYIKEPYKTEVVYIRGDGELRLRYLAQAPRLDIPHIG
jgi:hypothetical protein